MDSNPGPVTRYVPVTGYHFIQWVRLKIPVKNQKFENSRFPIFSSCCLAGDLDFEKSRFPFLLVLQLMKQAPFVFVPCSLILGLVVLSNVVWPLARYPVPTRVGEEHDWGLCDWWGALSLSSSSASAMFLVGVACRPLGCPRGSPVF